MKRSELPQRIVNRLRRTKALRDLQVYSFENIRLLQKIGEGSEGNIYCCQFMNDGTVQDACIKLFSLKSATEENICEFTNYELQEISLLLEAQDPRNNHIVKVHGLTVIRNYLKKGDEHLGIIQQRGFSDLLSFLRDNTVSTTVLLDLIWQAAKGVELLHQRGIVHRDINPSNLIIDEITRDSKNQVQSIHVRYIDLGMAAKWPANGSDMRAIVGTTGYHAPEMWKEEGYSHTADYFSLGITVLVMMLPPSELKKDRLECLLNKLHFWKVRRICGEKLFNIISKEVPSLAKLNPLLKQSLWSLLQKRDKRSISLAPLFLSIERIRSELERKKCDKEACLVNSYPRSRQGLFARGNDFGTVSANKFTPIRNVLAKEKNGSSNPPHSHIIPESNVAFHNLFGEISTSVSLRLVNGERISNFDSDEDRSCSSLDSHGSSAGSDHTDIVEDYCDEGDGDDDEDEDSEGDSEIEFQTYDHVSGRMTPTSTARRRASRRYNCRLWGSHRGPVGQPRMVLERTRTRTQSVCEAYCPPSPPVLRESSTGFQINTNYTMDNLRIIRKSQEEMKQKMVMEEQSTPVSRKRKASTNLDMPVKKYITRRTFRPRRNTGRKPKSIFEDGLK